MAAPSSNTWVIGGGIVGLASAIRLQEAGRDVVIAARDPVESTTSAVAAAVWYPYLAEPQELVLHWATRTLDALRALAADPAAAIRERRLLELFTRAAPDPPWSGAVGGVDRESAKPLPSGFVDGFEVRVPVVHSLPHLRWLQRRFVDLGGRVERRAVDRRELNELTDTSELVVNCAGLGARELCGDEGLLPVRGQIVRVANPGLDRCVVADEGPHGIAYIIVRDTDVILGGTANEGAWELTPNPAVTERILRAAAALEPRLARPEVLDVLVGLRPYRSRVRLERDERGVIHCYGHGGSGFTLSWGCADDVVRLSS